MSKQTTDRKRPTLALSMIVRNEEAVLSRCLDSVIGIVDEIVIVDTGSSDRTKQIAASYAEKFPGVPVDGDSEGALGHGLTVLDFEWCDDFAAARNFGLQHVSAEWVLALDADEELVSVGDDFNSKLSDAEAMGYQVNMEVTSSVDSRTEVTAAFSPMRLFRNSQGFKYERLIHESVEIPSERLRSHNLLIRHFGPSVANRLNRFERNVKLLQLALSQTPEDGYLWERLGVEYFGRQDWVKANLAYDMAYKFSGVRFKYMFTCLRDMAFCRFQLGRDDWRPMLLALQRAYPDYTDFHFVEGSILMEHGDTEDAVKKFRTCLRLGDPPAHYPSWGGTGSWRAEAALAEARSHLSLNKRDDGK